MSNEDDAIVTIPLKVFHVGEQGMVLREELAPEFEHEAVPAMFVFLGRFDVTKSDSFVLTVVKR